ncbi:MAG TPA: rhomboid family intramembrane serine protease, partial [Bacteroidia bacterium]|nr:rhomboid family intramembrane serine protease [Bacteroidia bacterium]
DEYSLNQLNKQKRIDEILDKISKSGYDALTKEEKDFLFKVSGRN